MTAKTYDAIIMGAGPAGLTAGLYLARAKKRAIIVDTGTAGGQPIFTHKVANYPGLPELNGYELAFAMKNQAKGFGCDLETNVIIETIQLEGQPKRLVLEGGSVYEAPVMILATGGTPRGLGIPSEETFKARGISYCATCDGDFFTGKDIVVVGGGNTAIEEAISLTEYASSVTILHQFDHFQAFPQAVEEARKNERIHFIMDVEVLAFEGEESLNAVRYRENETGVEHRLETAGVFIFIGYVPNSKIAEGAMALSPAGEIPTDENMATAIPGVYAAGDVRQKRFRQLTTAVSDGTIAALASMEYMAKVEAEAAGQEHTARASAPTLT